MEFFKRTLGLFLLPIIITSCQSEDVIIKRNIDDYIQSESKVLNDYKVISTGIIDTIYGYNNFLVADLDGPTDTIIIDQSYCDTLTRFYEKVYCDLTYISEALNIEHDTFCKKILSSELYRKTIYTLFSENTSYSETFETFNNEVLKDKRDIETVYGFSVKHKYRNRIDNDHILIERVFYVDKNLKVKSVDKDLNYYDD